MAATQVYTCDVCGVQRGETNHWFVAQQHTKLKFGEWNAIHSPSEFMRDQQTAIHLCGQQCATKYLEKFLSRGAK
jgi:hypothetical protein